MKCPETLIVAFKHNGKVHRTWHKTYLVEETDEYIVVGSTHSFVIEADGRKWHAIEPAISIFMKKQWFNVVCMMKESGICYYVNIASPSIYENHVIKYIDYDLDYKVNFDYEVRALDEYEYKKHSRIYNYSKKLDQVIMYNFKKVGKLIETKQFPFSHKQIHELYEKYLTMEEN